MNTQAKKLFHPFSNKRIFKHFSISSLLYFYVFVIILAIPKPTFAYQVGSDAGSFKVGSSGQGNWILPIAAPPGIGGITPKLNVSVSTVGSNGLLGQGGNLSGLSSISRCSKTIAQDNLNKSVDITINDSFCLDGNRLKLISGEYGADGSEYRTEFESFQKIIAHGSAGAAGPKYFEVHGRNGSTLVFGDDSSGNASINTPVSGAVIQWRISHVQDIDSNQISYAYDNFSTENGIETSIKTIHYGINNNQGIDNNLKIEIIYEDQPNSSSFFFSRFSI